MRKSVTTLGIETSCDETAAAVVSFDGKKFQVLGQAVASQIKLHRLTGGVVPEVAAREHVTAIMPTIKLALKRAGLSDFNNSFKKNISGIAVTSGPGLLPALMVGVDTANALSLTTSVPAVPVQHITGHIYANFLPESRASKRTLKVNLEKIKFPLLALIVSGGHTEFILMKNCLGFKKVGRTLDDAAGEAFDKTAKTLGLSYPGGPEISKHAAKGDPSAFNFPRPMINSKDLNFSFAGLKTSVLYKVQELIKSSKSKKLNSKLVSNLSASIQEAIVDTLVAKTSKALKIYGPKSFTLGGGVAANNLLREKMKKMLDSNFPKIKYYEPRVKYATDNAAMIAAVGAVKLRKKEKLPNVIKVNPQWEI